MELRLTIDIGTCISNGIITTRPIRGSSTQQDLEFDEDLGVSTCTGTGCTAGMTCGTQTLGHEERPGSKIVDVSN